MLWKIIILATLYFIAHSTFNKSLFYPTKSMSLLSAVPTLFTITTMAPVLPTSPSKTSSTYHAMLGCEMSDDLLKLCA